MKLSFKIDNSGVRSLPKKYDGRNKQAQHILAVQAAKDTEPFTPMQTGDLKNRTQVNDDSIIYPGPKSRYLYYGKLMVDPNTGSAWAKEGVTKVLTDKNLVFSKEAHSQAQPHWFEASKAQNLEKWKRIVERAVQNGR